MSYMGGGLDHLLRFRAEIDPPCSAPHCTVLRSPNALHRTWSTELRALVLMTSLVLFLSEFAAEAGGVIPMRTHDAAAARSHTMSFMTGPSGFEVR